METHERVAHHLDEMEQVDVTDEASAHVALAHAMAAVGTINQGLLAQPAQMSSAMASPVGGISAFRQWVRRRSELCRSSARARYPASPPFGVTLARPGVRPAAGAYGMISHRRDGSK